MDNEQRSLILVVDDQPKNLQLVASVLNEQYKLILVDSGDKAVQSAREKRPDLILLDIMMPGKSGFETCSELKKDPITQDIPIIFLTAKVEENDIVEAYNVGGADYVTKPFRFRELKSRMEAHISIRKQRDELVRLNQELLQANNQKSKMFSVISHDLKSGVFGMKGLIKILLMDLDHSSKEELRKIAEMCKSNVDQLTELLNDLLSWAKSQMEDASFELEPLDLQDRITKVMFQLSSQANLKHILLISRINEQRLVYGNKDMLDTILRNLISNAIKFSHEGGRVIIEARVNDGATEVSVTDNGVGIEEKDLHRIFDKNDSYSRFGTSGERGTGLGLDLSKDFVEKLNGKIWVESEHRVGSKFTFTLPLPKLENAS